MRKLQTGLGLALATLSMTVSAEPVAKMASTTRTYRAGTDHISVLKVTHESLPAERWGGNRVQVQEGDKHLVRRAVRDGQVMDGRFVRTTRTLTLTARAQKGRWRNAPVNSEWTARNADDLASTKQLGPIFEGTAAKVRLFAPRAGKVELMLLDSGTRVPLSSDRAGVWEAKLAQQPSALYGQRYQYEVDGKVVADPYAQLTDGDYGPSRFTNLDAHQWKDRGYDKGSTTDKLVRAGIVEVHVKDMTAHPNAPVDEPAQAGRYGGLAAKAILAHYKKLGVGGLELLPVQEYDDNSGDKGSFNHWGYMTTHYFAPERRYASEAQKAPEELQAAVDALHQQKLSVVMDVVYNHTAQGDELAFNTLGKSYYYRVKSDGSLANGAGTGNELASERPMARKLIIDSLRHFVTKYHVDGFRFDLGSLLDKQTMRSIERSLPKRIFLTAEPWAAEGDRSKWGKGDLGASRVALWNDDFRNAAWSFVGGNGGNRDSLMNAVAGSVRAYGKGWTQRPNQALNYLESHDELTVSDKLGNDKQRVFLANALLLTSQGIPMLAHGQEMMRTKKGISNAHNLDDETSWIDWSKQKENADLVDATGAVVALRRRLPQFHYDRPLTDKDIQWLKPGNDKGLGYVLPGKETAAVLLNSDKTEHVVFELPAGRWNVVVDGETLKANEHGLRTTSGTYSVPPGCAVVLTRLDDKAAKK
ncbi:MAG: alpha-amylase family glycosyl hydrolase [Polyangia bacterium]